MNEQKLKDILSQVKEGKLKPEEALPLFKDFDYKELNYAKIDNHRQLRTGYPEVVFAIPKFNPIIIVISS